MFSLKKLAFSICAILPCISALPVFDNNNNNAATKYIVTLKRGLSDVDTASHMAFVRDTNGQSLSRRGLTNLHEEGVRKEFHINTHRSYSGIFDTETINALRYHDSVSSVDPVLDMHIWETSTQLYAPWGLGSISHDHTGTVSYVYEDNAMADEYYAYVVDTGIRTTHVDFEGPCDLRVQRRSATFGVAKKSNLIAVKVCNANGSTNSELILAGLEFAYEDATNNTRVGKSVINMSLGGGDQPALTEAVQTLHDEGFTAVVAAGNEDDDAADYSPANSPDAITVGAIQSNYSRASFSNWGKDVDIFAPGQSIISLGFASDTATAVMSGTSMASPHIAGLVLYLKDLYSLESPDDVLAKLQELAVRDIVDDVKGSPNVLAFSGDQ
ncbi:subtilase [Seiridium cupressi]